jgi:cyclopropane-fatty-acyl-phospholipid synthase
MNSPTRPNPAGQAVPSKPRLLLRGVFKDLAKIEKGSISIQLSGGQTFDFHGTKSGPKGVLKINSYRALWSVMVGGTLGFSEAYIKGHWDSPDVTAVLEVFVLNRRRFENIFGSGRFLRPIQKAIHASRRNSRRGSQKNIMAHYDLGNDFYSAWLDSSMTYSSAKFQSKSQSLSDGQQEKYRDLAKRLDIQAEHKVLEIGCGWGGFAQFAAEEIGCQICAITISPEQHYYAQQRIERAGLSNKVEVRLCDYRDVEATFDRVVSIEMIEAVGEAFWPTYFATIGERLRSGGKAGLQVITIENESFDLYRRKPDFIQRHIFPGGMLPSQDALLEQIDRAGLTEISLSHFGQDYGRTLNEWHQRFELARDQIERLGFDEVFHRFWTYYLNYCEAGFRGGSLDVLQVTMTKPNSPA